MDPYLERFWGDVHHALITYARDQLQAALPPDLRARVEVRVFVESPFGKDRDTYPDIRVVERGRGRSLVEPAASGVVMAEPLVIQVPYEPVTEGYIEIIDVGSNRRVVTAVEVLSPSNKTKGEGQDMYLRKQEEYLAGRVNLVEIDLLRGGKRVYSIPAGHIPASHRTTYQVVVRRAGKPDRAEIYRVPLRERLPAIRIPLRETDKDVPLDLQALIEQCYRNGGYVADLDYTNDPVPPLSGDDAKWADQLLRKQGLRPRPPAKKSRKKKA
jgi:hypothetical protein